MKARQRVTALALALALAAYANAGGQSAQPEPQRRPQGPAAGPVIKLPPGSGAVVERAQTPAAKEEARSHRSTSCRSGSGLNHHTADRI